MSQQGQRDLERQQESATQPVPLSTVRLQLEPNFTLDDAAKVVPYLADLGVSHLYLSPILQSSVGSTHGYDVTDHSRIAEHLGGREAYDRLAAAAGEHGLRIVVDVVPNHMTTPVPLWHNDVLWSVLRDGQASERAKWFDIDWAAQDGRVILPVLGESLESVIASGQLTVGERAGEPFVRYFDHEFPVAPGTEGMPLSDLLAHQHYRLSHWQQGGEQLNYRRFFDVSSLIAVRVEDEQVFAESHAVLLDLMAEGELDGLRIDHPDGLADPRGYLADLAEATGQRWVVVEKILEGHEQLPVDWACAGTTGYDAMLRVGGVFVDPRGRAPLTDLSTELLGHEQQLPTMINEAKVHVVEHVLVAEVNRLLEVAHQALPELDRAAARRALTALLVGMDRYRVYVHPGDVPTEAVDELEQAGRRGAQYLGSVDQAVLTDLTELALGRAVAAENTDRLAAQDEFMVRFQQTCGPVMAKGIEDTTFYRFVRLTSLNEVGGDPDLFGIEPDEFHAFSTGLADRWPHAMTSLSTHDTKRSEDVRARLAVLSEYPTDWREWVMAQRAATAHERSAALDPQTEYLLWQTLVGAWPISRERLEGYAIKAVREAKQHTTWVAPDETYEDAVRGFVAHLTTDPGIAQAVEEWLTDHASAERVNVLGQKLVQLTMPGVPDLYQGTELVERSLVDPDNRRLVDYSDRVDRLRRLDAGAPPADLSDEKLRVTAAALRLRARHPQAFIGPKAGYGEVGSSSAHVVAFARGSTENPTVVTIATRLGSSVPGRDRETIELPDGTWRDVLSGREFVGGTTDLGQVIGSPTDSDRLPVALLERIEEAR